MLILLAAGLVAWILMIALVVALCRGAALGDAVEILCERPSPSRPWAGRRRAPCAPRLWELRRLNRNVSGRH